MEVEVEVEVEVKAGAEVKVKPGVKGIGGAHRGTPFRRFHLVCRLRLKKKSKQA